MDIKEEHNEFFHELDGRGFIFQNKKWLGGCFEDDQLQVVWEMWQAAKARMEVRINTLDEMLLNQGDALAEAKAQAVPNTQALHDRLLVKSIREHVESHIEEISVNDLFDKGWLAAMKCIQNNIDMLEAQEPAND